MAAATLVMNNSNVNVIVEIDDTDDGLYYIRNLHTGAYLSAGTHQVIWMMDKSNDTGEFDQHFTIDSDGRLIADREVYLYDTIDDGNLSIWTIDQEESVDGVNVITIEFDDE